MAYSCSCGAPLNRGLIEELRCGECGWRTLKTKDWFVACEHLNDIANVANHLTEPMHDLGTRWAYDTLWGAVEAIREDIWGPHDNQYPFALPAATPQEDPNEQES